MTRQEVFDWVREEFDTDPEYLWADSPDAAVLRNRSGKWYGIIMNVSFGRLGLKGEGSTDVLNVKADPMLIDLLVREPGFCRAYHMNKTQWISILLDGSAPEETIKNLLADSYAKTALKKKPAPKSAENC